MVSIFRKIRQRLLTDNKLSKYLVYAVGEIVLVVIGILIALQINNSNEQRKTRNFELKMLTEIRLSLQRDTAYFNILNRRILWIQMNADSSINLIRNNVPNDSLVDHYMRRINIPYTFMYQDGAYEALKASGIENVSNDTIRNELIHHYGFNMPRWTKLINLYRKDSDLELSEDLEWELFNFTLTPSSNDEGQIVHRRLKPNIIGSDSFNRYLRLKQRDARYALGFLKNIIKDTNAVLKLLDEELKNAE